MDRQALKDLIALKLALRLERMGMTPNELTAQLDLVRSGLLDSLGFVDLITELETASGVQVELEKAFDRPGATTLLGVLELFEGHV